MLLRRGLFNTRNNELEIECLPIAQTFSPKRVRLSLSKITHLQDCQHYRYALYCYL